MATTRRRRLVPEGSNTPAQQDEADILEEVGAVRDDDTGELMADEDKVREVGAVDAASVIENRRMDDIVKKKRSGTPGISFNTGDIYTKYETIIRAYPPNTLDISMKRLTGSPAQFFIISRPRSMAELHEAILGFHGQHEESDYEIRIFDNSSKEFRGQGKVTMPDTRPAAAPQQQVAPPYYPPPGYPYPPQQQQPAPAAQAPQQQPPPQPVVVHAPAGPDMGAMMATMQQMFGMFQDMQRQAQPPAPPPQAFVPPAPQQPYLPPPPPPGADPAAQMAWMKQAFELFQSVQPPPPSAQAPAEPPPPPSRYREPPPPQAPAPTGPTMRPPPGMMWGWDPGYGFMLVPAVGGSPAEPSAFRRPQYGEPRSSYAGPAAAPPPPAPPPRIDDQLQSAMSVVRRASSIMEEMRSMFPDQGGGPAEAPQTEEESPVRIVETGAGKLVMDAKDGSLRKWETTLTNLPGILEWVGKQREEIQRASQDRQRRERPAPQQIPPGHVLVTPGYEPPPGYVVGPEVELPPPPEEVPPPVQETGRRSWGQGQGEG